VIAVLNGSGKLVMESIVETKASSILQFIHGLRGELVTSQRASRSRIIPVDHGENLSQQALRAFPQTKRRRCSLATPD
jgi:hypothetical protein